MHLNEPSLNNKDQAVFFNRQDYQKICQALETLKSIRPIKALHNKGFDAQPTLIELLEQVATEKERLTLSYQKKVFLAVVPIEDVELIEAIENCIDHADADDALKEPGESLASEQVDKILGW